jgi:hypothetical protein
MVHRSDWKLFFASGDIWPESKRSNSNSGGILSSDKGWLLVWPRRPVYKGRNHLLCNCSITMMYSNQVLRRSAVWRLRTLLDGRGCLVSGRSAGRRLGLGGGAGCVPCAGVPIQLEKLIVILSGRRDG